MAQVKRTEDILKIFFKPNSFYKIFTSAWIQMVSIIVLCIQSSVVHDSVLKSNFLKEFGSMDLVE